MSEDTWMGKNYKIKKMKIMAIAIASVLKPKALRALFAQLKIKR